MKKKDIADVVECIVSLLKHYGVHTGRFWHVEDLHDLCDKYGWRKPSQEEAMEIFDLAAKRSFKGTGISQPLLKKTLEEYLEVNEPVAEYADSESDYVL